MTGIICMWSGAIVDIPDGWLLCDGNNGTPDLRNRFIVGAGDSYNPDAVGGSNSHDHDLETSSDEETSDHTHLFTSTTGYPLGGSFDAQSISGSVLAYAVHYHLVNDDTDAQSNHHTHDVFGFTEPQDSRPPYYALAYIMKT